MIAGASPRRIHTPYSPGKQEAQPFRTSGELRQVDDDEPGQFKKQLP